MSMEMAVKPPFALSDGELASELQRLARCDREYTASLVEHLAEFDARRLYLGAGCRSLFIYCTEVLRLSEHEAYNRIEAARIARKFPRVLEMLVEGTVNLTTVRLVAPHLTEENQEQLLKDVSHKSKREVEEAVVRYAPRPPVPSTIRRAPTPGPMRPAERYAAPMAPEPSATSGDDLDKAGLPAPSGGTPTREVVRPLASERYEIRFTARAETREKLRLAIDLLRHAVPNGDMAEVIDRALTVLLEDLARKKFAATARPKPKQVVTASSKSRHIPARVKRAVWLRDGGRCAFVGKGDRRCKERGFLEFHHVRPYAVGGAATENNIQIRCRAHNAYEADLFYGPAVTRGSLHGRGSGELVPERVPDRSWQPSGSRSAD